MPPANAVLVKGRRLSGQRGIKTLNICGRDRHPSPTFFAAEFSEIIFLISGAAQGRTGPLSARARRGWGWSKVWKLIPADRYPWFTRKRLELNTKSHFGFVAGFLRSGGWEQINPQPQRPGGPCRKFGRCCGAQIAGQILVPKNAALAAQALWRSWCPEEGQCRGPQIPSSKRDESSLRWPKCLVQTSGLSVESSM